MLSTSKTVWQFVHPGMPFDPTKMGFVESVHKQAYGLCGGGMMEVLVQGERGAVKMIGASRPGTIILMVSPGCAVVTTGEVVSAAAVGRAQAGTNVGSWKACGLPRTVSWYSPARDPARPTRPSSRS
eukprot:4130884-Prymnesium_polylepis.1